MNSFADEMHGLTEVVGIKNARVLSFTRPEDSFGNCEAILEIEAILLKFVKDRGQIFLEISSTKTPAQFHSFDDVEVVFGKQTISSLISKKTPDDIVEVLIRFKEEIDQISESFSDAQVNFTNKRIDRISQKRGQAFMEHLRDISNMSGRDGE